MSRLIIQFLMILTCWVSSGVAFAHSALSRRSALVLDFTKTVESVDDPAQSEILMSPIEANFAPDDTHSDLMSLRPNLDENSNIALQLRSDFVVRQQPRSSDLTQISDITPAAPSCRHSPYRPTTFLSPGCATTNLHSSNVCGRYFFPKTTFVSA